MRKKPMSANLKKEKMLSIFHEKKEIFNLKEIEKFSVKAGIVLQSVKDILMDLISDNLVDSDKIGAANFYWSLPSKTYQTLITKNKELEMKIQKLQDQKKHIQQLIEKSKEGKKDSEKRSKNLEKLAMIKAEYAKKEKEVQQYHRNDPTRKKQLELDIINLKQNANLWTDNTFNIISWVRNNNPGMSDEDIRNSFQIPADFDNIP